MMSLILLVLSVLLSLIGCIYLSYSQEKHAKKIFGKDAPLLQSVHQQRWGWGSLILSLLCQSLSSTMDFAIILWPIFFGANAFIVAMLIAFRPEWLRLPAILQIRRR